jgi:hypothetical protein
MFFLANPIDSLLMLLYSHENQNKNRICNSNTIHMGYDDCIIYLNHIYRLNIGIEKKTICNGPTATRFCNLLPKRFIVIFFVYMIDSFLFYFFTNKMIHIVVVFSSIFFFLVKTLIVSVLLLFWLKKVFLLLLLLLLF